MKRASVVFLVFFVMFVMASGAFAQEVKPCTGDIAKFCGNVKPGEGRMARCLKKNEAQLSPVCKMHVKQVEEAVKKEVDQACVNEIKAFCGGLKAGEGRVVDCLKAQKAHLSPKCKAKVLEEERKIE